jgi:GNAT superfamily N-acetyltransferase
MTSAKDSNLVRLRRIRFGRLEPMAVEEIEVRRLSPTEAREQLDALAGVLADCVAGGASVGYLDPFSHADARVVYDDYLHDAEQGRRIILGAFLDGNLVGTAQLVLAVPPNQPHRAEVARVLVHRSARRRGIAQRLMEQLEQEARAEGKTLLVLDAVTGGDAARLYDHLGWITVGVIPDYALYPDGRFCDTTVFWKALEP